MFGRFHATTEALVIQPYSHSDWLTTISSHGQKWGGVVLDPFLGSGTTCVAALREHRHFLGFELNKEYFDIAQRRITLERQQPTLDFD